MRIMMLSANTGEGHNSSAKALMEVLKDRGVECDLQDTLACLSPGFSKFVCNWHVRIYKYGGKLFDYGYRLMEHTANPDDFNPLAELLNLGARKLSNIIREGDYDAIVCVHPFSAVMATEVRESFGLEVPTFLVATDYTCSPTVEHSRLDTYFLPAAEIAGEFAHAGIPEEHMFTTGIPVRRAFYRKGDRATARAALELPEDAVVVLLMCGSMGCGPLERIAMDTLERLPENAVMVAACGRNEKLKEAMDEIRDPRLRVLGFTDRIGLYMDAVDMMITKPGGLSCTEAANKRVPMVFVNAVGGCESRNFDFFTGKGFAVGSASTREVVNLAVELAADREKRDEMRRALEEYFVVNTGELIADKVIERAEEYRNKKKAGA